MGSKNCIQIYFMLFYFILVPLPNICKWQVQPTTSSTYYQGNARVMLTRTGHGVSVSPGVGHDSQTRELSNKPKNIYFEAKLKELQLILQNSSKLAVSPSFLGRFGCFWTCFDGLTCWVTGMGVPGFECGSLRNYPWVTHAIPYNLHQLVTT